MTTNIENLMVPAAVTVMVCSALVYLLGGWGVAVLGAGLWLLMNAAIVLRSYQLSRRRSRDGVS